MDSMLRGGKTVEEVAVGGETFCKQHSHDREVALQYPWKITHFYSSPIHVISLEDKLHCESQTVDWYGIERFVSKPERCSKFSLIRANHWIRK